MKVANLEYHSGHSIDRLVENIGLEESRSLLAKALPIIIVRKDETLKALEQSDISAVHKQAHKTSGSIRLYGSSRLETLLLEAMSLSPEQTKRPGLHHELASAFDAAINEIKMRLKTDLS